MKWYKASEELPPYGKCVLVAGAISDGSYVEDCVLLAHLFNWRRPCGDENMWEYRYDSDDEEGGWQLRKVYDDDRWAYIELPED